ncbi:DUF4150 domain-containing protein [Pseudenhygromyxa sp. WMMC2535]|nr:PAAR-like domain-containing protein [Pseudenhygromyxa sp. WMMC2535]NVB38380.1 DUF4150 domain-containing protein [Pseudenhygromyxa sp. WMMC2535]
MPNVCKMPGPPAPFVPTPLPNVARVGMSMKGATKTVKIEGKAVAIKGVTFKSTGDIASKGTGGGIVSGATHGTAKFVSPGSMDVKAEGKNIHLLGDAMTNNNSNPANAATIKELQAAGGKDVRKALKKIADECNDKVNAEDGYQKDEGKKPIGKPCTRLGTKKHKCCQESIEKAGNPYVKSEVPYDKNGKLLSRDAISDAYSRAGKAYKQAKAAGQATRNVWGNAFFGGGGGATHLIADVVVIEPPATRALKKNIRKVYDFKFNCEGGGKMEAKQKRKYKILGKKVKIVHASW